MIDVYRLARNAAWRYELEQYEKAVLRDIQRTVEAAKRQILSDLSGRIRESSDWTRARQTAILGELDELSLGLRQVVGDKLATATASVGSASLQEAYEQLSVGGLAPVVNNLALSPDQFKQFLAASPVQGLLLPAWVDAAFAHSIVYPMTEQLQIAGLRGEGYAKIVRRMEDGFEQFSRRELVTMARTYMQSANVRSQQAVMDANRDIIDGWIWTITSDDRVCPLCLPLSENFYGNDEQHPPIPRHPRCRCFPRSKTKSWRELGIDVDELEPIEQAVVTRGYEDKQGRWTIPPVDVGGAKIQQIRFYRGGIKEAWPNLPAKQRIAMIGPRRFELIESGKVRLEDLVDRRTGKLFLLKDLI